MQIIVFCCHSRLDSYFCSILWQNEAWAWQNEAKKSCFKVPELILQNLPELVQQITVYYKSLIACLRATRVGSSIFDSAVRSGEAIVVELSMTCTTRTKHALSTRTKHTKATHKNKHRAHTKTHTRHTFTKHTNTQHTHTHAHTHMRAISTKHINTAHTHNTHKVHTLSTQIQNTQMHTNIGTNTCTCARVPSLYLATY